MHQNLFAWTSTAARPAYVSLDIRSGKITLDARGPEQAGQQFGTTVQIELPAEVIEELHQATRRDIIQEGLARRDITKSPNAR